MDALHSRTLSDGPSHTLHPVRSRRLITSTGTLSVDVMEDDTTLVAIPSTVDDFWWRTIDSPRTDEEFIDSIADLIITKDGRGGKIREVLDAGGWPILLTHWQSLFSAGLETGLAVLDEVGKRVNESLAEEVEWQTCSEIARLTLKRGNFIQAS